MHALSGWRLLRGGKVTLVLVASCLHWIACAPFHGMFSIHVTDALRLSPSVVGFSAGLGVTMEILVMFAYPRFADRFAPRHLLFVAFAASGLRWLGLSLVDQAWAILALNALHGLTFGLFYVAAVAYVARQAPPHLRATAQALFVAATFGLGGLVGYLASGLGYDVLGGHQLFAVAAGLEVVAGVFALLLPPAGE